MILCTCISTCQQACLIWNQEFRNPCTWLRQKHQLQWSQFSANAPMNPMHLVGIHLKKNPKPIHQQDEAYIKSTWCSTLVGLKPAYIRMWVACSTTVLQTLIQCNLCSNSHSVFKLIYLSLSLTLLLPDVCVPGLNGSSNMTVVSITGFIARRKSTVKV